MFRGGVASFRLAVVLSGLAGACAATVVQVPDEREYAIRDQPPPPLSLSQIQFVFVREPNLIPSNSLSPLVVRYSESPYTASATVVPVVTLDGVSSSQIAIRIVADAGVQIKRRNGKGMCQLSATFHLLATLESHQWILSETGRDVNVRCGSLRVLPRRRTKIRRAIEGYVRGFDISEQIREVRARINEQWASQLGQLSLMRLPGVLTTSDDANWRMLLVNEPIESSAVHLSPRGVAMVYTASFCAVVVPADMDAESAAALFECNVAYHTDQMVRARAWLAASEAQVGAHSEASLSIAMFSSIERIEQEIGEVLRRERAAYQAPGLEVEFVGVSLSSDTGQAVRAVFDFEVVNVDPSRFGSLSEIQRAALLSLPSGTRIRIGYDGHLCYGSDSGDIFFYDGRLSAESDSLLVRMYGRRNADALADLFARSTRITPANVVGRLEPEIEAVVNKALQRTTEQGSLRACLDFTTLELTSVSLDVDGIRLIATFRGRTYVTERGADGCGVESFRDASVVQSEHTSCAASRVHRTR